MSACGVQQDLPPSIARFKSGELCRTTMRQQPAEHGLLVGENIKDVEPVNLIAAVKMDCPSRQVIAVCESQMSGVMAQAQSAGADCIVDEMGLFALIAKMEQQDGGSNIQSAEQLATSTRKMSISRDSGVCISLLSGRGGVGKSTLCIACALAAHKCGLRVAVVDFDAQFGDLRFMCGKDKLFYPIAVRADDSAFSLSLDETEGIVPVVYPQANPEYHEALYSKLLTSISVARENADLVLVNTGSFWNDTHADVMMASDIALFVMDQRPTSVEGCKRAKDLCIRMGIPSTKFAFALNRCTYKGHLGKYDCALSLGVDNVCEIADGGNSVEECLALGHPSILYEQPNPILLTSAVALSKIVAPFGLNIDSAALANGRKSRGSISIFGRRGRDNVAVREG